MEDGRLKTAVVTGATSGIGAAIATALATAGYRLVVTSRDAAKLAALRARLRLDEAACVGYEVDFGDPAVTEAVAARMAAAHADIDVLVHSAGYLAFGDLSTTTAAELDTHYSINVRAPWVLTHHLLPGLVRRRGQVVFINTSASTQHGKAGLGAYVGTKLALKGVADCLRQEVNREGVRVVSIYPGRTATEMQATIQKSLDAPYRPERLLQPEDVATTVMQALAMPETAEITDLHLRPMQNG